MGARLQSEVSSGKKATKGAAVQAVETNAGPDPASHPNKMAVNPGSQFEQVDPSGDPSFAFAKESRGIGPAPAVTPGNSPQRAAGKSTGSVSSQDELQSKGLTK